MNIELPSEFQDYVKDLVAKGRFSSEEEAVVEGIRLLMGCEQLRGEIQKGVKQIEAGEWVDDDSVFTEVESAISEEESTRQGE